jgi:hypothetical protein
MPILSTDIVFRLSGGASNSNPLTSLGGAKSTTAVPVGIFDDVGSAESAAGDVEYRCVYVHNANASLTLQNAVAYFASNTPSADTDAALGVGTSAVNGTEQAVADEGTAPAGVTFSAAASKAAGVALGDIPAGQHRAVWVRRTVNASAAAANDGFTVNVTGDTAA